MYMPRAMDALPWARKPDEFWLEADFITGEAHLEAASAIVDPFGVLRRQTSLHVHLPPWQHPSLLPETADGTEEDLAIR
jgi:hypothetical protein